MNVNVEPQQQYFSIFILVKLMIYTSRTRDWVVNTIYSDTVPQYVYVYGISDHKI